MKAVYSFLDDISNWERNENTVLNYFNKRIIDDNLKYRLNNR